MAPIFKFPVIISAEVTDVTTEAETTELRHNHSAGG